MRMISYVTEFYQRIGSCVVVVVLRAVDTRRRLHPYNDHTLWRLGGAGDAVGIPRNCCSASRPDIRHGCRRKTPSTSNKNCIPLQNKTRTNLSEKPSKIYDLGFLARGELPLQWICIILESIDNCKSASCFALPPIARLCSQGKMALLAVLHKAEARPYM